MSYRPKILDFWRGPRRSPKWDLGTPPNPRGRSPFRRARRKRSGLWWFGGLLVVALLGPVAVDATSLLWRESNGCSVVTVVDGDTVRMICPQEGYVSGRLLGFDTPEMNARCPSELTRAIAATYHLRWALWTAGEVTADPRGRDGYDRVLTMMTIDGVQAGRVMTDAGLARWYSGGPRRPWCS